MEELTLEMLDEAISLINKYQEDNEIIGFRLHPDDLSSIKTKTVTLFCVSNNMFTLTPPYMGMMLISDINVPPGYPEPIRRGGK